MRRSSERDGYHEHSGLVGSELLFLSATESDAVVSKTAGVLTATRPTTVYIGSRDTSTSVSPF